ncbi:ion transport peptide isoform X2 [Megachile rotundata]|nr:PREDICTED: ion transport peptide-like isoform X3 [Megachile rotundata]XP_012149282.1 PREDICTED: ion transport peptide-like isoform X3 [Megachile rotundata]XP_012149283.1 PREDICTED: ion transport peptide-like isoform X3 [Megachile rotundata]XP_012149284.1 PREDICTED: ion transport peptide-like isoform X3 [Megachile rotundata]XP_012149285.1 PREDICTED: ion transport peptide-like isoform X3 [Megachile rotundata]XP_012149286.1 PREDICTED: ion transport peptide-like isoform X3 [Megachile rotundata]
MHRQQRLRSPSLPSSSSSLSLPLSTSRSPVSTSSSPMTLSASTSMSSASQPSASTFLSSTSTWPTSNQSYSWSVQQTSCSRLSSLPSESSLVSTASIPCPRLVSVLAWSVTLLLVSSCIGLTDAGILNGHPLGKRSFIDIQCKGIYDKSIFARLDRICEDCYNLFREPQLHQLCRKNCFTSDYFKGCLDVLLLQDEVEKIQTWIKQLHGAEPGV